MEVFKDTSGYVWSVEMNVATLQRVIVIAGVDLMGAIDPVEGDDDSPGRMLITRICLEPTLACTVIYAAVSPQANKRWGEQGAGGAGDAHLQKFAELMGGLAMAGATAALTKEMYRFFSDLGRRELAAATLHAVSLTREIAEQVGAEMMPSPSDPPIAGGKSGRRRGSWGWIRRLSRWVSSASWRDAVRTRSGSARATSSQPC